MSSSDGFTIQTAIAGLIVFTPVALVAWICQSMRWFEAVGFVLTIGVFGGMAVAAKIEGALKLKREGI